MALTEGKVAGDVVKMEADQRYSRDVLTIADGQTIVVGSVLYDTGSSQYGQVVSGQESNAAAVALEAVTTSGATGKCVALVRHGIVVKDMLTYSTATATSVDAALKALGILVKDDVQ